MMSYDELISNNHIFLNDGATMVILDASFNEIDIIADYNGIKEPNIFGRDIFYFGYKKDDSLTMRKYNGTLCNPENPGASDEDGMTCASRLL